MVVRGVYSKEEEEIIAAFNKEADEIVGWAGNLARSVASEESIKNKAMSVDYWNPLWRDDNYAKSTRWGGIIAPPMYQEMFGYSHFVLHVPPSMGPPGATYIGEDWDLYKPVHPGDTFKVWRRRPQLHDITSLDGKGLRRFTFMPHDMDHINQRDELVSTFRLYLEYVLPTTARESRPTVLEYKYTKEELAYIDHLIDEEEIRGNKIRYWEDVNIGEVTRPAVAGPTTVWDMVNFSAGSGVGIPLREARRKQPWELVTDPNTNITHQVVDTHFTGLPGGYPIHFGAFSRQLMARCVTNWMGDDGLLRKFNWRHMTTSRTGDTVIARARVTDKRIENDEHLVDLSVWVQSIRGNITEAAFATVSLLSKEVPYIWK